MPHVEENRVRGRVEDAMERDDELHGPQRGTEVPPTLPQMAMMSSRSPRTAAVSPLRSSDVRRRSDARQQLGHQNFRSTT